MLRTKEPAVPPAASPRARGNGRPFTRKRRAKRIIMPWAAHGHGSRGRMDDMVKDTESPINVVMGSGPPLHSGAPEKRGHPSGAKGCAVDICASGGKAGPVSSEWSVERNVENPGMSPLEAFRGMGGRKKQMPGCNGGDTPTSVRPGIAGPLQGIRRRKGRWTLTRVHPHARTPRSTWRGQGYRSSKGASQRHSGRAASEGQRRFRGCSNTLIPRACWPQGRPWNTGRPRAMNGIRCFTH